jgi:hypothetical protein
VRYRDRYRPAKGHRQTLRGFPTGMSSCAETVTDM